QHQGLLAGAWYRRQNMCRRSSPAVYPAEEPEAAPQKTAQKQKVKALSPYSPDFLPVMIDDSQLSPESACSFNAPFAASESPSGL
ncbi:MAG: hypothetical protein IIY47_00720, partial [Solobacterium sp.]|nr:hypothetical protein [Solobacterium sp.]